MSDEYGDVDAHAQDEVRYEEHRAKVEWKKAPDFAEVAEALGIATIDILAVFADLKVLFTPYPNDNDPMIYQAEIGRDADGLLVAGPSSIFCSTSEFEAEVEQLMMRMKP